MNSIQFRRIIRVILDDIRLFYYILAILGIKKILDWLDPTSLSAATVIA